MALASGFTIPARGMELPNDLYRLDSQNATYDTAMAMWMCCHRRRRCSIVSKSRNAQLQIDKDEPVSTSRPFRDHEVFAAACVDCGQEVESREMPVPLRCPGCQAKRDRGMQN